MNELLEHLGFLVAGISKETQDKFDAIKPDLDHLSLVLRAEMPRVNRVAPVLAEVIHEAMSTRKAAPQPAAPKTVAPRAPQAPEAPKAPAYDGKGAVKGKKFF